MCVFPEPQSLSPYQSSALLFIWLQMDWVFCLAPLLLSGLCWKLYHLFLLCLTAPSRAISDVSYSGGMAVDCIYCAVCYAFSVCERCSVKHLLVAVITHRLLWVVLLLLTEGVSSFPRVPWLGRVHVASCPASLTTRAQGWNYHTRRRPRCQVLLIGIPSLPVSSDC